MATKIKIKKEGDITPEYIKGKLFSLSNAAHSLHLETKSFAEHKALGKTYEDLVGLKDGILESLMGYTNKRVGSAQVESLPDYSKEECKNLANEIMEFGYELYEWAESKKYCDVENKAQDLSGVGAKLSYLLTLT